MAKVQEKWDSCSPVQPLLKQNKFIPIIQRSFEAESEDTPELWSEDGNGSPLSTHRAESERTFPSLHNSQLPYHKGKYVHDQLCWDIVTPNN